MTAFPANPYFCLKTGKHDVTLTWFMADVLNLVSFPLVRMCQIDGLEGIENLAMVRTWLQEVSQKNERGGAKIAPLVSRGLRKRQPHHQGRYRVHPGLFRIKRDGDKPFAEADPTCSYRHVISSQYHKSLWYICASNYYVSVIAQLTRDCGWAAHPIAHLIRGRGWAAR